MWTATSWYAFLRMSREINLVELSMRRDVRRRLKRMAHKRIKCLSIGETAQTLGVVVILPKCYLTIIFSSQLHRSVLRISCELKIIVITPVQVNYAKVGTCVYVIVEHWDETATLLARDWFQRELPVQCSAELRSSTEWRGQGRARICGPRDIGRNFVVSQKDFP